MSPLRQIRPLGFALSREMHTIPEEVITSDNKEDGEKCMALGSYIPPDSRTPTGEPSVDEAQQYLADAESEIEKALAKLKDLGSFFAASQRVSASGTTSWATPSEIPYQKHKHNNQRRMKSSSQESTHTTTTASTTMTPSCLPASLPKPNYSSSSSFTTAFIEPGTGKGLVATTPIPAGTIIFADPVMLITCAEQATCPTPAEADAYIATKVRAMGPAWTASYLRLSNPCKSILGAFMGVWNSNQTPVCCDRRNGGIVGLNLAGMNHSCVPNCTLSIVSGFVESASEYEDGNTSNGGNGNDRSTTSCGYYSFSSTEPHDGQGEGDGDDNTPKMRKPHRLQVYRAVVRATNDIPRGRELTIAYIYGMGTRRQREMFAWTKLGYACVCKLCVAPDVPVERALQRLFRFELICLNVEQVLGRPAVALQMARDVVTRLLRIGVRDARVAQTQAARAAGNVTQTLGWSSIARATAPILRDVGAKKKVAIEENEEPDSASVAGSCHHQE
ncbi:hypothetical protein FE257_011829 [Aspergillus nanangensis]|uniref:SET domain-containing protein n=1 Tax=Aspergillus nanangensis TaxID=2582783 RepID=A0AAD4GXX3_ASPNN|nr:hypothetical protein FE257_011829 [Aspergillus nanangensis]